MSMLQTMRWFGPNDPVSLHDIRQAGCTGIVTSLHQHKAGIIWGVDEIKERQSQIQQDNDTHYSLHWAVVESILVHDDIKRGLPSRDKHIEAFKQTIRNLATCGINTICYNFMPVLDWTRTNVKYKMPDGSLALRFDWEELALFDICILKRKDIADDYVPELIESIKIKFETYSEDEIKIIHDAILMGLPGTDEPFEMEAFKELLDCYKNEIGETQLRENLYYFLRQVVPVAQEVGSRLCIHPDDPPFPLLGLPRVVSTEQDLLRIIDAIDSPANGITFCTGSLGSNIKNDLVKIVKRFGHKIHFIHLRSVKKEVGTLNFFEADHLAGDVDMYAIIKEIIIEQKRRFQQQDGVFQIPMRPDHGHQMLDDLHKKTYPGYSMIGRLRGLAEIRGVEFAIERALLENNYSNL